MKRLYKAAAELKGITSQSAIGKLLNVSPQAVKNWETRGVSKKGIIEASRKLGISAEWLEDGGKESPTETVPISDGRNDTITFQYRDISVTCGSGFVSADFPEIIRTLEIPKTRLAELFGRIDATDLDMVGIQGDSMEPTLPQKGPAFIDTRVNSFAGDGIYVFFYLDGVYMKRLQKSTRQADCPLGQCQLRAV